MGFTPYSKPVEPAKWVDPMDLNLYAKSMMYKQELAEKNLKNFTDKFISAFNLPAYGIDADRLSKIEDDFRNKLSSMNLSNLSDMSTVSQMNNLINQYTSGATNEGKDLMAIAKRGSFYQNELKKKQEADEKGLPYYSKSLKQLENYYNSPDFLTSPKNVSLSSGFIGVNLAKERNEALKNVPKEKYIGKDGYYHERYNPDALRQALTGLYSNEKIQSQILYDIEEKWKDKDWETEGINEISSYRKKAEQLYNEAIKEKRQDIADDALSDMQTYDRMLQDPKGYAEQIKNRVYSKELQDRIDLDMKHSNFDSVEKMNEYSQKAQDLANSKAIKLYDLQLKTGILPNPGESQDAYMQRLSQGAYEKDLAIAQAKQDIKTEAQKEVESKRQEGREKILNMKFNQAVSKLPSNKQTPATKTLTNLAQGAAIKEEDEEIIKSLVGQNSDKILKEFKDRTGRGIADEEDIEVTMDPATGDILIDFDVAGPDLFGRDEMKLSQEELANLLQDKVSEKTTPSSTGASTPNSAPQSYSNVTQMTDANGKTINAGVKNGRWYNTDTNEELK